MDTQWLTEQGQWTKKKKDTKITQWSKEKGPSVNITTTTWKINIQWPQNTGQIAQWTGEKKTKGQHND